MGTATNIARHSQLGMPWGTAMHKLRKSIMFRLMQKCGEDTCFKCGLKIETVDDLSIEHKESWLGVSPDLFWDLDNVTWSHRTCNKVDRPWLSGQNNPRTGNGLRRDVLWCRFHKEYLSRDAFTDNSYKYTGKEDCCRECRKKYRSG